MSAAEPGLWRRTALRVMKVIPARPSHAVVRAIAPTFSVGAVAILEHDGQVLVMRQLHRTGWSLPGGLVDRGEHPDETVVREVEEETGLRITSGDIFATVVEPTYRHIDVIYRVRCPQRPEVQVASEAVAAQWFDLAEVPDPDEPTRRILAAIGAAANAPRAGTLQS